MIGGFNLGPQDLQGCTRSMQEEVRLHRTLKEREEVDIHADLYSIFMATESLEKAYIRDIVRSEEYMVLSQLGLLV